jgi:hypothetical protein
MRLPLSRNSSKAVGAAGEPGPNPAGLVHLIIAISSSSHKLLAALRIIGANPIIRSSYEGG